MITCPSCNHQNPEGSLQCENCYTPLPATIGCPNCGASVQTDATFCGQCGFNLQAENPAASDPVLATEVGSLPDISLGEVSLPEEISQAEANPDILPETSMSSPIQSPWDEDEEEDLTIGQTKPISNVSNNLPEIDSTEMMNVNPSIPDIDSVPNIEFSREPESPSQTQETTKPWEADAPDSDLELESTQVLQEVQSESDKFEITPESTKATNESQAVSVSKPNFAEVGNLTGATQLQVQKASLLHLQSNTTLELASNLDVIHIGKPNGQIPPDIDVAGFPDSEVVSRVHADIRVEGDAYYIEDIGSSNGTYINHTPLLKGNRHRLRVGDRIALGKGDLVTFIFQLN